jgi:hypothetical protein
MPELQRCGLPIRGPEGQSNGLTRHFQSLSGLREQRLAVGWPFRCQALCTSGGKEETPQKSGQRQTNAKSSELRNCTYMRRLALPLSRSAGRDRSKAVGRLPHPLRPEWVYCQQDWQRQLFLPFLSVLRCHRGVQGRLYSEPNLRPYDQNLKADEKASKLFHSKTEHSGIHST